MLASEEGVQVFVFFFLLLLLVLFFFFFSFAQTDTFHLQVCRSVLQDIALGVTSCWFTLHSVLIYNL